MTSLDILVIACGMLAVLYGLYGIRSVLAKPAEETPLIAAEAVRLLHEAGIPNGALQLLPGDGRIGAALVNAPEVAGVMFTGSTEVGRKIGAKTGEHIQSACLELGGKNPMVVMPDANLSLVLAGALFAGFGTAGQRCTSLGSLWLHESVHDEFLAMYGDKVESAIVGDPMQGVLFGPMLSEKYLDNHVKNLDMIKDHHKVMGSTGIGRITAANPRSEGYCNIEQPWSSSLQLKLQGVYPLPWYGLQASGTLQNINTFDISAIPVVKKLSHLPVVADPSHGAGRRDMVPQLARAAVAAGADGLIIEVHNDPDHAWSDGAQSMFPAQFDRLMAELRIIAPAIGRSICLESVARRGWAR